MSILLYDAAHLQEEDAQFYNQRGIGKHRPSLPLFDRHGVDLWRYGGRLLQGRTPGRPVTFRADGVIPPGSVCPG